MANESHNMGNVNQSVQAHTIYGGIHDNRQVHTTRARRPRSGKRLAMACACTIGLLTASAVAYDQTAWMFLPGPGEKEQCLLPAARIRSDQDAYLTNFATSVHDTVLQNNQIVYGSPRSGWVDIGGSAPEQPDDIGDSARKQPVAACDAQGRTVVLTTGGGALQVNPDVGARDKEDAAGPPDRVQGVRDQWRSLGGTDLVGEPAAARDADGRLVVVVRDRSGSLWETHQHLAGIDYWSELTELSGDPVDDDPVLRADRNGELHSFALTQERAVRIDTAAAPGRWRSDRLPQPAYGGAVLATTPSVIDRGDGCFQLLSVTEQGAIAVNNETKCNGGPTAWQGWDTWESPNREPFVRERPIMVADANSTRVAYALDEGGTVRETVYVAKTDSWTSWKTPGNVPADPPKPDLEHLVGATLDAGGQLVLHGFDKSGRVVHTHQEGSPEGGWASWTQTPGATSLLQAP